MKEQVIRAFAEQARYCTQLGSPLTAQVCTALAENLDESTEIGGALLQWHGNPDPKADSLPLRVAGALHALARNGRHPELAACYPPHAVPDVNTLWSAIAPLLESEHRHFSDYLRNAPQTNEVGRSTLLMAGLLEVVKQTRLPVHLFEIGASAGLNTILDRYRYRFGETAWGNPNARLCLEPVWSGNAPPTDARIEVRQRRGVDLNPLNLGDAHERERLLSYVWADQIDRLERIEAAIATALDDLPAIDRMDAADWLEAHLHPQGEIGVTRVLMHSIVWSYLSNATRERIQKHLDACAQQARKECPLAWVRFELDEDANRAVLRVTIWPTGTTRDLALGHPHGASVKYLAR